LRPCARPMRCWLWPVLRSSATCSSRNVRHAYPFALSEALVLAFLAGYLLRQRRGDLQATSRVDSLMVPSRLFASVVLASCLVQLPVLQVWHDYPLRYAAGFVRFLATEYLTTVPDPRPWVDGRGFVSTAALLLEGVALLCCVSRLCRQQPALARRVTNVVVAAGAGTAILSFCEVAAIALSSHQPVSAVIYSARWTSSVVPSIDTAGPYFLLVASIAIGTAAASRARPVPAILAAAVIIGALWLTQTRSAIVAGLMVTAAVVAWWGAARFRWLLSQTRAILVSVFVALAAGVGVITYNPFHLLWAGGIQSLHLRALFAQTALRMMATQPLLGVGVGQYESRYPEFASAELLRYYAVNDAHNYFLWVGAELGLIGLGLFLWLLVAALSRGWSRVRARQPDYWRAGILAGLAAFIITWSIGQPLAVPQVAYTFWIVLGAVAPARLTMRLARPAVAGCRSSLGSRWL